MNLKSLNFFALVLTTIFFTINVQAQNKNAEVCSNLSNNYNGNIRGKDYTAASKIWEQRLLKKCTLSEFDYYNAACIYSTFKQENLALKYLYISVNKGYYDTAHMLVDSDLDNIRNTEAYKKIPSIIINKIKEEKKQKEINLKKEELLNWQSQFDNKQKQKWQFLKAFFAKVDVKKLQDLIPYCVNNNWGYMNKTGKAVTKAIFEFTDFSSKHGLLFKYKNEYFFYTLKGDIDKLKANTEAQEYGMMADNKYNIDLFDNLGFTLVDGRIAGHNKEYDEITILPTTSKEYQNYKEAFGSKTWAIVTNKDKYIAIIDSAGNPLNNIFNFSKQIGQGESSWSSVIVIEKRILYKLKSDKQKEIPYEINGQEVKTDKAYSSINYIWWNDNNLGNKLFNIFITNNNYYKYSVITFTDNSSNILIQKNNKLQVLFPKYYNNIIGINGTTALWFNGFQSQSFTNKNTDKIYFLVQENESTFYIDADGVEYKLKVGL